MKFRNKTDVPATITVRTNPEGITKYVDSQGNDRNKPAPPKLHTIHIPALAEVEIDDVYWKAAWAQYSKVDEYEMETSVVQVSTESKTKEKVTVQTPMPTGKVIKFYPLRAKVKAGDFEITEKVKTTMTEKEVRKILLDNDIPVATDLSTEKVFAIYDKIMG